MGQANVDVPLGVDRLPLLERGRGHMTGSGEEDCGYLIGSAAGYLEFHSSTLTGEKLKIEDRCLVSGLYHKSCYP